MSTSNHDHALDLLPWFLNGTLDADEHHRVEEHLARCDACRRELEATRSSFELHSTHLPPQALTAYVEDPGAERYRMPDGPSVERSVVDAHLAHCLSCREELELARESRRALAEEADSEEGAAGEGDSRPGGVVPFRPATPAAPPPADTAPSRGWAVALAASLVFACVAAGGWFLSGQELRGTQQRLAELEERLQGTATPAPGDEAPAPDGAATGGAAPAAATAAELAAAQRRSDELAGTVDELERQVADMERQVDRLAASASAPRSGVRYVIPQPLSGGDVLRGDGGPDGGPAPQAPADGWVYLAPELPARHLEAGNRFGYDLRDPQGESLVAGTLEVAEDPAIGPFVSLVLPTTGLPDGPLTLVLTHPQDGEIARYGFVVAD